MPRREGDFSPKTIRTLALRAGYLCSNPDCRHSTSGPHSDPDGFIITGEAAHIGAAAKGGPRYDEKQSPEERKAITNAIWLCGKCNKKIDTDWKAWPKERLLEMKTAHEKWISAEAMIPLPPVISLRTQPALRFSQGLKEITPPIQATYRDQELVIENPNRVDLFNLKLDLNLPEVLMCGGDYSIPPGVDLRLNAVDPPNQAVVRGNASATDGQKVPTTHWTLQADKLGPGQRIVLGFYTAKPEMTMQYDLVRLNPDLNHEDPEKMDEHKICFYFLEGKYQFLLRSEYVTGNVFVPLSFKADTRMTESRPVQTSSDPWRVARASLTRGADLKIGKGGLNVVWTNVVQY
jgi:hypothetical protein